MQSSISDPVFNVPLLLHGKRSDSRLGILCFTFMLDLRCSFTKGFALTTTQKTHQIFRLRKWIILVQKSHFQFNGRKNV